MFNCDGLPLEDEEGVIVKGTASRSKMLQRVLVSSNQAIDAAQLPVGIELVDVRLKHLSFPDSVIPGIYGRCKPKEAA